MKNLGEFLHHARLLARHFSRHFTTGTVGMVVQMPLHTVHTQEREVMLQLSRVHNIPWRCFGCYSMWCNTGAPPNKEGMIRRPPRRSGTTQQGGDRPIPPGGSFLRIIDKGGWFYNKRGRHGPAPSDFFCDIFLSVTFLFYRSVVKTYQSRYNSLLIILHCRLVCFAESEEWANSSPYDQISSPGGGDRFQARSIVIIIVKVSIYQC